MLDDSNMICGGSDIDCGRERRCPGVVALRLLDCEQRATRRGKHVYEFDQHRSLLFLFV